MNRHTIRPGTRGPAGPRALLSALVRILAAAGLALLVVLPALGKSGDQVYVMPTSGIVDQVMEGYLRDGIAKADRDGFAAVVIQLDTPGGALEATHNIVQILLNAPVPVIVWVGPSGARAASAGTFITLASHVAVMAPAARIGAATPIDSSGQNIGSDLATKIMTGHRGRATRDQGGSVRNGTSTGPSRLSPMQSRTRPRKPSPPVASMG